MNDRHRLVVLIAAFLILIIAAAMLISGCGQNVVSKEQFKEDCQKKGGTYTVTDQDEASCTYDN